MDSLSRESVDYYKLILIIPAVLLFVVVIFPLLEGYLSAKIFLKYNLLPQVTVYQTDSFFEAGFIQHSNDKYFLYSNNRLTIIPDSEILKIESLPNNGSIYR